MNSEIRAYKSPESRIRTEYIGREGGEFCIAEKTKTGALVTRFARSGAVKDQVHYDSCGAESALSSYLGGKIVFVPIERYERVVAESPCKKCKEKKVTRELDLVGIGMVENVPVIPLFRCLSCGERFYSMSSEYLGLLAERNAGLFEDDEIKEKEKDGELFIKTLNEYVIRIFASKRISRLV